MRKRRFSVLLKILFALLFCLLICLKADTVYAADAWYTDYTYTLWEQNDYTPENYIVLKKYNGQASNLRVPATAVINGVSYRTMLSPEDSKSIWYGARKKLTRLTFEKGCIVNEHCTGLFYGLSKLKSVNVEVLDMSQVHSTAWMFAGCSSLTKLNVANWDVSNVTNMFNMFGGCEKLSSLDVSKWDTSNVTVMVSVFDHCKSLYKINVSNWDVSNVTTTQFMFYKCEKLYSLDLHKWDTSKNTDMFEMFGRCYNLRTLNVKGWDTSNVTTMAGMFVCNYNLTSLDLSSFDISKVTFKKGDDPMFLRCASLKTLKTPKNRKTKLTFNSGLSYKKKGSSKTYNYVPKGKKSITLVCAQSKSPSTSITSIKSSKKKIYVTWKPVSNATYAPVQYEVQCSTNKKFTDAVGIMTNAMEDIWTYSVQDNVTDKTKATFKGLTKGKTYYVRVRVYTYNKTLSKWSKVKKIKCK